MSRNTGIGIFVVDGRSLEMNDLATVSENAESGIYNAGNVTVNGFASVSGNRAASMGGGMVNSSSVFTVLVMNHSASVNGNTAGTKTTAGRGGGIWNAGRLVVNDQPASKGTRR